MAGNYTDDWRPVGGDMADFQNEARKRDLFADIKFVIGKGESSKTFSAHKAILACGSPVFEKMFYGDMPEERSIINIEDDDPEAFEMLLSVIYGKVVQISSFIGAWKYYVIGDKYLVPGIETVVTKFISSTPMNEDNFWEIIEEDVFLCQILVEKLISFIRFNAGDLLESEKILNMPEALISIIVQMDELNIKEYTLLTSVTLWAYNYMGRDANSKGLLHFLKHIRFSMLTTDEFSKYITSFPSAIDAQSSLEIFKHLNDRKTYQLPDWCSKSRVSRKDGIQSARNQTVDNQLLFSLQNVNQQRFYGSYSRKKC